MNRLRAFTLIELLVVISIIALLISILLPALRQAREQARISVCGSNFRQIGIALYTYANDSKDELPKTRPSYVYLFSLNANPTQFYIPGTTTDTGIGPRIYPYLQDGQVTVCPSWDQQQYTGVAWPKSYAERNEFNAYVTRYVWYMDSAMMVTLNPFDKYGNVPDKLTDPIDWMLGMDLAVVDDPAVESSLGWRGANINHKDGNARISGANTLYLDGHVVFESEADLTQEFYNLFWSGGKGTYHMPEITRYTP